VFFVAKVIWSTVLL